MLILCRVRAPARLSDAAARADFLNGSIQRGQELGLPSDASQPVLLALSRGEAVQRSQGGSCTRASGWVRPPPGRACGRGAPQHQRPGAMWGFPGPAPVSQRPFMHVSSAQPTSPALRQGFLLQPHGWGHAGWQEATASLPAEPLERALPQGALAWFCSFLFTVTDSHFSW